MKTQRFHSIIIKSKLRRKENELLNFFTKALNIIDGTKRYDFGSFYVVVGKQCRTDNA